MTISKKLLITGALILGMQPIMHAYDTNACGNETTQMLDFAQTLRQVNNKDALNLAQWLEQQVCDTSYNVQDCDIVAITHVINNPNLTIPSKISVLSQTMTNQKSKYRKNVAANIAAAAFMTVSVGSMMALIVYDALYIQPMRPRRPTVTIRYHIPANQTNYYQSHYGW